MRKKIGILTCSSKLYPSMAIHVMEGLYAYSFSKHISTDHFVVESIGHAGDYKLLQQKVETFLLQPDVSALIAFVDVLGAECIEPFVNATGKILITVDIGAHVPGLHIPSPHHLSLSLQSAYGTVLGAQSAIKKGFKLFTYASSLLDAGYTQVYATWSKINQLQGDINYHFTTPVIPSETNLDYLKAHVDQKPSDALLLQFCALGFTEFQYEYQCKELDTSLPVIVAPFLLEREWLSKQQIAFTNCKGFTPWDIELATETNRTFINQLYTYCGKEATVFHVLGWDTALLLEAVLEELNKPGVNAMQVVKQVAQKTFDSPRGAMVWNKKFNRFVCPMYEAVITKKENVHQPELTGVVEDNIEFWEAFAGNVPTQFSNWKNMYLCPT